MMEVVDSLSDDAFAISVLNEVSSRVRITASVGRARVSNGSAFARASIALAPDALVRKLDVRITVGPSDWSRVANVASLRRTEQTSNRTTLVLDFGAPRTLSGVAVLDTQADFGLLELRPWLGASFAPDALDTSTGDYGFVDYYLVRVFDGSPLLSFPDIQTQKLQIVIARSESTEEQLAQQIGVQLPDEPADFELRIDGGPPVWSHRGPTPAAPSSGEGPVNGWFFPANALPYTTFDLGPALTLLCGDPLAGHAPVKNFEITLSARVPGALGLDVPETNDLQRYQVQHIARVTQGFDDGKRALRFEEEGVAHVPLALPSWATGVVGARSSWTAKLPPERTLPAEGPELALGVPRPDVPDTPLASLTIDPAHATALRLPLGSELPHGGDFSELMALRLPLLAAEGGAELLVELRDLADDGGPGEALPGARSQPVSIDAGGDPLAAPFITFPFPKPVKLKDQAPAPWAVVLVTRGSVSWSLAAPPSAADPNQVQPDVLRGAPTGPWLPLPALELRVRGQPGTQSLPRFAARVRQQGRPPSERPIAPIWYGIASSASATPTTFTGVTPTPKGVRSELETAPLPASSSLELQVVALVAGGVSLAELDLILTAAS